MRPRTSTTTTRAVLSSLQQQHQQQQGLSEQAARRWLGRREQRRGAMSLAFDDAFVVSSPAAPTLTEQQREQQDAARSNQRQAAVAHSLSSRSTTPTPTATTTTVYGAPELTALKQETLSFRTSSSSSTPTSTSAASSSSSSRRRHRLTPALMRTSDARAGAERLLRLADDVQDAGLARDVPLRTWHALLRALATSASATAASASASSSSTKTKTTEPGTATRVRAHAADVSERLMALEARIKALRPDHKLTPGDVLAGFDALVGTHDAPRLLDVAWPRLARALCIDAGNSDDDVQSLRLGAREQVRLVARLAHATRNWLEAHRDAHGTRRLRPHQVHVERSGASASARRGASDWVWDDELLGGAANSTTMTGASAAVAAVGGAGAAATPIRDSARRVSVAGWRDRHPLARVEALALLPKLEALVIEQLAPIAMRAIDDARATAAESDRSSSSSRHKAARTEHAIRRAVSEAHLALVDCAHATGDHAALRRVVARVHAYDIDWPAYAVHPELLASTAGQEHQTSHSAMSTLTLELLLDHFAARDELSRMIATFETLDNSPLPDFAAAGSVATAYGESPPSGGSLFSLFSSNKSIETPEPPAAALAGGASGHKKAEQQRRFASAHAFHQLIFTSIRLNNAAVARSYVSELVKRRDLAVEARLDALNAIATGPSAPQTEYPYGGMLYTTLTTTMGRFIGRAQSVHNSSLTRFLSQQLAAVERMRQRQTSRVAVISERLARRAAATRDSDSGDAMPLSAAERQSATTLARQLKAIYPDHHGQEVLSRRKALSEPERSVPRARTHALPAIATANLQAARLVLANAASIAKDVRRATEPIVQAAQAKGAACERDERTAALVAARDAAVARLRVARAYVRLARAKEALTGAQLGLSASHLPPRARRERYADLRARAEACQKECSRAGGMAQTITRVVERLDRQIENARAPADNTLKAAAEAQVEEAST